MRADAGYGGAEPPGHGLSGRRDRALRRLAIGAATFAVLIAACGGDGSTASDATTGATQGSTSTAHVHHGDPAEATAADRAHADAIVAATKAALRKYADIEAARADGFALIAPTLREGTSGYLHLTNARNIVDSSVLDPERIEALVYTADDDGGWHLVAGMFILPPGKTLADAPDVAGPLAVWHDHQELCWREDEIGVVAGMRIGNQCPGGGAPHAMPMLHVWVVENECGPFADLKGHGARDGVCRHPFLPEMLESELSDPAP